MTPTEIRTALERLERADLKIMGGMSGWEHPSRRAALAAASADIQAVIALLSALPGETAPVKVGVSREWCEQAARDEEATGDPDCTTGQPARDTGPAPPRALVEVVREWQEATAGVELWGLQGGIDGSVRHRLYAAETALLAYTLPAPEAVYDEAFGDDRICQCGHTYYRHFDSYDDMRPIGCKYCECATFIEPAPEAPETPACAACEIADATGTGDPSDRPHTCRLQAEAPPPAPPEAMPRRYPDRDCNACWCPDCDCVCATCVDARNGRRGSR